MKLKPVTIDVYNMVRKRVREETPTGFEIPRLTLIETILCEMISECAQEIMELKLSLDKADKKHST